MSHLKKMYVLKREREEAMFSSPKTPSKKIPYKDMVVPSMPFATDARDSSLINEDPASSDVFACTDKDPILCGDRSKMCDFVCKTGEGAFYEVFVNRKGVVGETGSVPEEPVALYKSRELCAYDVDYTVVKKSKKRISGELDRKSRIREIEMLKKIDSEYVVKYYDFWESRGYLFIELEYCNIGTLRDYIHEVYFLKKSKFSPEITRKMMYELASGLEAIHSCNIVHLDLKPENILMKSIISREKCPGRCQCMFPTDPGSFVFKISDFNISRYEGEDIDDDGDKRYMAPEVLQDICTKASDIYSLGLIYLEVIAEIILPKSGDSWMRLRRNDFRGVKLDRVCKLMLDMNYRRRLSAREIVNMFT
ncbi:SER/THR PROTEIN KINASE [Encephalitozoon cuniculi GB-M1]|uniref:SER/THR PROTEIN KINASE n=2 Tax=Encephalitozoon cuniculi TaxID=6035 RepID=Q8SR94_ENCCU|nr:serine/threonine kinase [Encephalitozoon cuniculi GB-M1]AGE95069.1 ser/thr protein kinase [Encephalitozoon cuniculi]KMV65689.1 serine/threonine kinase [Encephalitozoon cuniculi EcunIII-L]UYI27095.1 mitosis inhibitor protein kinase SWE1 [Encephalitozoon cuniculi]CAD26466.1 SER/THR PROTEIN KINASE [Encephalitozoon cuniculi GB-M1]